MKKLLRFFLAGITGVVWFGAVASADGDTVTLWPAEDATISEKDPAFPPLGSGTTLDSGTTGPNEGGKKNRALLKFDLAASIPSDAMVTSATLKMTVVQNPPVATNLWFSLHKVLSDWSESAVTWTNRLSLPAPWSTPGGAAPGDYSSLISQSNLITGTGSFTFTANSDMASDVQNWVSNSSNNFGWILICELEDLLRSVRKFGSRDASVTTNRPSLEVQFTLPTPALTLTVLPPTNGLFQFHFNAGSNQNYWVEYCADLAATNWIAFTNITPLPTPATILVSEPLLTDRNRFFRVRTP